RRKNFPCGSDIKIMYYPRTTAMPAVSYARQILSVSILSTAFFLSGCGGGGLAQSVADSTPDAPQVTSDTASNALIWLNFRRQQAGLAALTRNSDLDQGAKAHSEYQKTNDVVSHDEDSSLPGYTGATPFDRMQAAGYTFPSAGYAEGEVI